MGSLTTVGSPSWLISLAQREKVGWLETMIQDAQWRKLIYDLSEADKSCVLLQYAIQVRPNVDLSRPALTASV